jgi:oxygen-dependent protoporphyrinogen oxidase
MSGGRVSGRARVVVVGGGVAGLVVAHRLATRHNGDRPPQVLVLEAGRVGGKLRTIEVAGLQLEGGADSFVVRKPWAVDLCKELGLGEDLVKPGAEGAFVWARGGLVPFPKASAFGVPSRARDLLAWPGLSARGRLRAMADLYHRPVRGDGDRSLGELLRRRMGPEATRVLLGPLLAGIHAGDPDRLSVQATFPELERWDRLHGSLIRGARATLRPPRTPKDDEGFRGLRRRAHGSPGPLFTTLWHGLSSLVDTLVATSGSAVRVDAPVEAVGPAGAAFEVRLGARGATPPEMIAADAVVLAVPAFEAARLLDTLVPPAARELRAIPYASTAAVFGVYPAGSASRLPEGTGFVVPIGERTITACTWVSRKWPRDQFGDRAVVRSYVGRAVDERPLDMYDDGMSATVAAELGQAVPGLPDPEVSRVVRWDRAMPQYEVGHLGRVRRVEEALAGMPGLFVTGSAYRGVGIADCVRQANETAELVRAHLHGEAASRPASADGDREAISWST